jgi:hypothetical protein
MARTLVARPGSKALDDNPADDDLGLLDSAPVESEIICQMSS